MKNLNEVCNAALHLIGEEPVADYTASATGVHGVLQAHLKPVIREVQSLLRWPELTSTATLIRDGDWTSPLGVPFTLPSDALKLLRAGGAQREYIYEETGSKLWVRGPDVPESLETVYLRYSENPSEWSALLTTSVVKLLAARILGGIGHDLSGAAGLEQRFWAEWLPAVSQQTEDKLQVRGQVVGATLDGLCESALRLIGAAPVSDWRGEASIPASALRSCLFPVIREVQSLTRWAELISRERLQWTGKTDSSRGRCFYRPKGCLRVLSAGSDWEEEGGYLFVRGGEDEPAPLCRYVRYSENPAEWSSELFGLTAKLLAARIASAGASGDPNTGRALEQEFWAVHRPRVVTQVLNRARRRNDYSEAQRY